MQAMSAPFRKSIPARTGVLVVGAGPTGLALACDLRSRGVAVTIIDKADGPATTSRALGLQPRGTEILDRLGALGDLPQRAVNATGLNIFVGDRRLVHLGLPARPGVAIPGPLIIGQAEIEAQLRARLAGLQREVAWKTELVSAAQTRSGIEVTLRDADGEATIHADWLVGCDGAHSRTRKLADIAFDGTAFAERFLLADVQIDWDRPHREIALWMHADGMFAAMPLPGPDSWRVMVELPDAVGGSGDHAGGPLPDADAVAILQRLVRERVGDRTARVRDPNWVSLFRFHRRLASSYRCGRIFLAGDAAHIHSPFGGQGMNTGLGDAYNLGWKLAMVMQGLAGDSLLDTYEIERRPVAREVLARTTNNTNMLLGNSVLARLVRDLLFLPMLKLPAVQRKMTAKGSQLGVNYRGGPLARGAGVLRRLVGAFGTGPRAGDRAPDAACHARPAGAPTTLGRETCAGWALLLFGGQRQEMTACAEAARSRFGKTVRVVRIVRGSEAADWTEEGLGDITLEDRAAEIARLYGCRDSGIVLLRPDGHLAWRAASPKPADLARWLSRVFDEDTAPAAPSWRAVPSVSG